MNERIQRGWAHCSTAREDMSAIVGLQTARAFVSFLAALVAFYVIGLQSSGVASVGGYTVCFLALAAANLVLLRGPGTPLGGWGCAIVVIAEVLAAAALVAAIVPIDRGALLPYAGAVSVIGALLCLRGRAAIGWVLLVLVGVVLGVLGWRQAASVEYVVVVASGSIGVLVLLTVFAGVVEPRVEQIFVLRRQAREASAALIARAVRDAELERLDHRVRPLLNRISAGDSFTPDELVECELIAAALRDRIRAPGLDSSDVADAVWRARQRGVQVILLDDGDAGSGDTAPGLGPGRVLDEAALAERLGIRSAAIEVLNAAEPGAQVTARILPRGRGVVGTVTVASALGVTRREIARH